MSDHITFGTLTPEGLTNVRQIERARIMRCPLVILAAEHYPPEGGPCRCEVVGLCETCGECLDYCECGHDDEGAA